MESKGYVLSRVKNAGCSVQARCPTARGHEDRAIEDVVTLRAGLDIHGLPNREFLGKRRVELTDAGAAQAVASEVPKGAGLGNGESRRVG